MINHDHQTINNLPRAGLFRRVFAITYDLFLLVAILFIITAIANALNGGKAIEPTNTYYPLYVTVVVLLSYLYFSWFWINGGQTLGMKTWRMRLVSSEGNNVTWKQAFIRSVCASISWAFFGLGFLWALFDKHKRCWHDILSDTVLLDLRKKRSTS